MKSNYNSPEIEIIKFSFDEIMAKIDISQPEDTHMEGGDLDF